MKFIGAAFEVKELTDAGTFEGLASVYGNVDLGGDVVEPGAFKEIVKTRDGMVRILEQHDMRRPIGKGILTDTHVGLAIKGKLNLSVSRARDVYELMKDHTLDGLSIGYDTLPGGADIDDQGVRHLRALKLWEVSPVTFGMNPAALVSGVKTIPQFQTVREVEAWIRDEFNLTNSAAKEFVARFKQALAAARDEQARDEPLQAAVKETLSILSSVSPLPQ
jgi:HK97 family phage prohead protease